MKLVYKILLASIILAVNVFPQELNQRLGKNNSPKQIQSITWSALGSGTDNGVNGTVNAVAVLGDYIYVGGSFSTAGGITANNIARWNTTNSSWSALTVGANNGVDGTVYALAVDASNNNIYAGGSFTHAGGISAAHIAGWYKDPDLGNESWNALGSGVNNTVYALAIDNTSHYEYLYVGGAFTSAGGTSVNHIASCDIGGSGTWSNYFSPGVDGNVYSIVVSGSNVYVGGSFANSGTTALSCIASYNTGTIEWSSLGSGMSGTNQAVYAISLSGSNIYAGGVFDHAGGVSANNIAEWDGSNWTALGNGVLSTVNTVSVAQQRYVYAGGSFTQAGGASGNNITKWDGASWSALGDGADNTVRSITISGNSVYAAGDFTHAGGNSANHIAEFLDTDFNLPTVTTTSITNISLSTATGGGNVTNNGGFSVSARGVCWGTSQYPTTSDSHTTDGSGTGPFTSSLTGLADGTVYHVRAYATNFYGTSYGSDVSFLTFSSSPGTALSFGGTNKYVNIPDDNILDLTTNYTIEAWIKPEAFSSMGGIVSKYQTAGANGYYLRLTSTGNYDGLTFDEMSTSNGILTTGNWYHVAAVNNGGTRHLYLNGVEQALTGTALNVSANTDPLCIGVDYKSSGRYFIGDIDEVRIWNVARSEQEIREDMHRTLDNDDAGLVAYWQFNDGSGSSTLGDAAGGHTGTLTNMDNANAWVSSTIPTGGGTSNSQNDFTSGTTTSMGNVQLTTSDAFDNSVNLVNTEIDRSPNATSEITGTVLNKYYVIHAYGTPGSFAASLTFTLPEGNISLADQSTPSNLKLYHRDSNSDGDWSLVTSASSATATTVMFDGITSFSQFTIASASSPLPVELTSFTAASTASPGSAAGAATVELKWETATEVNNYGFDVERSAVSGQQSAEISPADRYKLNAESWTKIGFVKGSGNSNSPKSYSFVDKNPIRGKVEYRLKQIDNNGGFKYSSVVDVTTLPKEFSLSQNYPNPFNPTTAISYQLSAVSNVTLKIYDALGREVTTLVNGQQNAGVYNVVFDGGKYSSGVYIYKIDAVGNDGKKFTSIKKLVLLK